MKKKLKIKNETKELTLDETLKQFEKFIYHISQRYKQYEFDEMVQVANLATVKAYKKYDISKNIEFSTYLGVVITNDLNYYHRQAKKHNKNISLNEPVNIESNNDHNLELMELIKGNENVEDSIEKIIEKEELKKLVNKLDFKEKKIIYGLFYKERTQYEVGKQLGITQPQVSRMKNKILVKLNMQLMSNGKVDF